MGAVRRRHAARPSDADRAAVAPCRRGARSTASPPRSCESSRLRFPATSAGLEGALTRVRVASSSVIDTEPDARARREPPEAPMPLGAARAARSRPRSPGRSRRPSAPSFIFHAMSFCPARRTPRSFGPASSRCYSRASDRSLSLIALATAFNRDHCTDPATRCAASSSSSRRAARPTLPTSACRSRLAQRTLPVGQPEARATAFQRPTPSIPPRPDLHYSHTRGLQCPPL